MLTVLWARILKVRLHPALPVQKGNIKIRKDHLPVLFAQLPILHHLREARIRATVSVAQAFLVIQQVDVSRVQQASTREMLPLPP